MSFGPYAGLRRRITAAFPDDLQLQGAIAGAATAPAIIDAVARSWGRARTLAALDTGCREAAEDAAARREALLVDLALHLDMRITRRAVCRHAPTWRDAAAVVENCDDGRTGFPATEAANGPRSSEGRDRLGTDRPILRRRNISPDT